MANNVNQWTENVEPLILEQYKESSNWAGLLRASIEAIQKIDDDSVELSDVFDFEANDPTGYRLDYIASLVNVKRLDNETDLEFLSRLKAKAGVLDGGTPNHVIYESALLSSDPAPSYHEEATATFYVYTPRGRQLYRSQVRNMAPAGVLGFPAAALTTATGKHIVTSGGKTFLCVAQDANSSPVSLSSAFAWATVNTEET